MVVDRVATFIFRTYLKSG